MHGHANVQTYPPPPAFFRLYREDADGSAERPLPPAPPVPVEGEFQMFGELHTVRTWRSLALATLAACAGVGMRCGLHGTVSLLLLVFYSRNFCALSPVCRCRHGLWTCNHGLEGVC